MKSHEILAALPRWAKAKPDQILDSPAFALPCRLGEESVTMTLGAVEGADTLDLSLLFGDEPHELRLSRSPRFPELNKVWDVRSEIPAPILLALVEKECGAFFQLLENAVRRQLRLSGLADADAVAKGRFLHAQVADVSFSLTRTESVASALGSVRYLDIANPALRAETLAEVVEYAAFAMPQPDMSSIAVGDAILLPEIGSVPPRLVVDRRYVVEKAGVMPFEDDGRCRVVSGEPRATTLGELFDASEGDAAAMVAKVEGEFDANAPIQLRLVQGGRTVARGRLDRIGEQNAFVVEAVGA